MAHTPFPNKNKEISCRLNQLYIYIHIYSTECQDSNGDFLVLAMCKTSVLPLCYRYGPSFIYFLNHVLASLSFHIFCTNNTLKPFLLLYIFNCDYIIHNILQMFLVHLMLFSNILFIWYVQSCKRARTYLKIFKMKLFSPFSSFFYHIHIFFQKIPHFF